MSSPNQINFLKMHGLLNSFVLISDLSGFLVKESVQLAKNICSPQAGIGADGIVFLRPGNTPRGTESDFTMDYYNADGSKAEMCGNAIRCLAKMVVDEGLSKIGEPVRFNTGAGVITTMVLKNQPNHAYVSVAMGVPSFTKIGGQDNNQVSYEGFNFNAVSLGNPHAVTFVNNFDFDYHSIGKKLQLEKKLFPAGVNVEFAQVLNPGEIKVRVIERGVGETMACGTGACAVAAQYLTQAEPQGAKSTQPTKILLLGGELVIHWDGKGSMLMEGPTSLVANGVYYHSPATPN